MKKTELFGSIQIMPISVPNPDPEATEPAEGKQIVITDHEGGEVLIYTMGSDLAARQGRKLKMSNRSLQEKIQEEHDEAVREAEAEARRQSLLTGNGGAPTAKEQQIADDILKGVHRKEE